MTDRIGPSFHAELLAAGIGPNILPAWDPAEGTLRFAANASSADRAKAVGVLEAHEPSKPGPAAPYGLLKKVILSRMTDGEIEGFDQALTTSPVRTRRMWADSHEIRSDEPFFASLRAAFASFGDARAEAILAPNAD